MKKDIKQLSPDAPAVGGAVPAPKKPSRSNIPRKDDDLLTLAKAVSVKWLATPGISLIWKTPAQFSIDVANYGTSLGVRQSAGSLRPDQTQVLKDIDTKINTASAKVKTYIKEKYDTTAQANAAFPAFGFVHTHKQYPFPADHDKRKASLLLMIAAIAANGFDTKPYGTIFWKGINTDFLAALGTTTGSAKTISEDVGGKNMSLEVVRKVLTAMLLSIEANYPDDFKNMKRAFGYLKENY